MQSAKDTFYEVMRARLAAVNPDRTVVLRGATRPALAVGENELVAAAALLDCFWLRWVAESVDAAGTLPLAALTCEVTYTTAGTAMNAGMDRGRALAAMDAELCAMVNASPQTALKTNFSGLAFGGTAKAMSTSVWWGDIALGKSVVTGDRLGRTATVTVMSYAEAGER